LRSGFVTSALEHGADVFKVMDVTRHRRVETLKGYDWRAKAFRDHAGGDSFKTAVRTQDSDAVTGRQARPPLMSTW
jgi:hypothetical protein